MSSTTQFHSSTHIQSSSPTFPATTPPSSKPPSTDSPTPTGQDSPHALPMPTPVDSQPPPPERKGNQPADINGLSSDKQRPNLKRSFEFSLPSDQAPRPSKRTKKMLTTVSAKREKDVQDLHSLRMLQLARASREAFAANVKYRLMRIHELDVMRTIAFDEYEEAVTLLKSAEYQVGETRHFLVTNGTTITTLSSLNLSSVPASYSDSESSVGGISHGSTSPSSHFDS